MRDLTAQQTRQLLDCEQLYGTYRSVRAELKTRFAGSMTWKSVKGRTYLYRKTSDDWRSLGPQDEATLLTYDRFRERRAALRAQVALLDQEIRTAAPVNRALGLGRVPRTSARLLRRLEREGLLGQGLRVVGTHALYAYERMGGVHFGEEAVTTQDLDLLFDARATLKLIGSDARRGGLIGLLQRTDASFRPTEENSFRAVNAQGFMVDLISPRLRSPATQARRVRIGDQADELRAAEIEGLTWLESSPAVARTAIDDRGYPLTIVAPDPRAFACHKAWLAGRDDRDPLKRRRDIAQARTLIDMLVTRLPQLRFDDPALQAVPAEVLALGTAMAGKVMPGDPAEDWD